jgi:hypothetical protein
MVVSMTLKELEKMAQETAAFGVHPSGEYIYSFYTEQLQAFAKLVAQHEREACAKLEIELILSPAFFATMGEYDAHKDAVLAYRNLIRARGQA